MNIDLKRPPSRPGTSLGGRKVGRLQPSEGPKSSLSESNTNRPSASANSSVNENEILMRFSHGSGSVLIIQ